MNVFTALSSMMAYYRSERREGEKGERERRERVQCKQNELDCCSEKLAAIGS